ncbi:hypothetical protein STANM309S_04954 [Streptomyces tanashiensis]
MLYALRQEIGREAFDRLERVWVARHRDGNASTADFVRLASETAGRDLTGFLHAWLYDDTMPRSPRLALLEAGRDGGPQPTPANTGTGTCPARTGHGRAAAMAAGMNTVTRRAVPCDHRRVRATGETGISRGTRTLWTVTEGPSARPVAADGNPTT